MVEDLKHQRRTLLNGRRKTQHDMDSAIDNATKLYYKKEIKDFDTMLSEVNEKITLYEGESHV